MSEPAAWLVLVVPDGARQHGGNDGYDDVMEQHYSWDSTVPNHARVSVGDHIILWDKEQLLGVSIIEEIERGETTKLRHRCPACHRANFKARQSLIPRYRCFSCGHQFAEQEMESRAAQVITYRSRHDGAWTDLAGELDGATLRRLADSSRSQHSIRSIDWERFAARLRLEGTSDVLRPIDDRVLAIAGGHRLRTARIRVGQGAFRKALLERYGARCAVSGPAPAAALDAAHLYSYAALGEHFDNGGLLLRSDVHVLFDAGLLAVNPDSLTVDVETGIRKYPAYGQFHGGRLAADVSGGQVDWLRHHWRQHRTAAPA